MAEKRSEQLALEKAEAESRAMASLQARIAAEEALTRQRIEAQVAARQAAAAARARAEREEELALAAAARAEADGALADAKAEQTRADQRALEVLRKKVEIERRSELEANRRADAESAAADVLRAGIAAEEALETQRGISAEAAQRLEGAKAERLALKRRWAELRPRRLPLAAGVLAVAVLAGAAYLMTPGDAPPTPAAAAAGEPLQLKLEFAFPAARR